MKLDEAPRFTGASFQAWGVIDGRCWFVALDRYKGRGSLALAPGRAGILLPHFDQARIVLGKREPPSVPRPKAGATVSAALTQAAQWLAKGQGVECDRQLTQAMGLLLAYPRLAVPTVS